MDIIYKEIVIEQLTTELFDTFSRFQESKQIWQKENGQWVLKDVDYIRNNWDQKAKENFILPLLRNTLNENGFILGAFSNHILMGLISIENKPFGSNAQYLHLNGLWITHALRGNGIGTHLFKAGCQKAISMGGKKLYICANPAKETIAFYKRMGCVEALEINDELLKGEPNAFHMELSLL